MSHGTKTRSGGRAEAGAWSGCAVRRRLRSAVLLAALLMSGSACAVCSDAATRCRGDVAQSCEDGDWVDERDCASTGHTCSTDPGTCGGGWIPDIPGANYWCCVRY